MYYATFYKWNTRKCCLCLCVMSAIPRNKWSFEVLLQWWRRKNMALPAVAALSSSAKAATSKEGIHVRLSYIEQLSCTNGLTNKLDMCNTTIIWLDSEHISYWPQLWSWTYVGNGSRKYSTDNTVKPDKCRKICVFIKKRQHLSLHFFITGDLKIKYIT